MRTKKSDSELNLSKEAALAIDKNTNKWNLYILNREINNVIRSENKDIKSKIKLFSNKQRYNRQPVNNIKINSYLLSCLREKSEQRDETCDSCMISS
jgi:hypothetical protein